jgi:predicted NACHT family NTPase
MGKEQEPTMSVIVTGREHVVGTHLRRLVRIRVSEFDDEQIRELADKWFEQDSHLVDEFYTQLAKVPTLRPLMRVPLLATLVLGVYRNTKTLPESRVSLYEMFVSLLAGGWDVAKNVHRPSEFGPTPKLTVLCKLAATLHMGRRRDCNQLDFKSAVKSTLPALGEKWQVLLEEVLHDGLLIPAGIIYAFAHLSFQEYLTARYLFEPSGRKVSQAFRTFLAGDDWWREVVTFFIGLSRDPKDLERFIKDSAQRVLSKTADDSVRSRFHFLLEMLMSAFPGAQPNFTL